MKKIVVGILIFNMYILIGCSGVDSKLYQNTYEESYSLSFNDPRDKVISLGLLAPSSHNMQPWGIELDELDKTKINLYINTERTLEFIDKNYIQMVISCGTFITYAVEGAKNHNLEVTYDLFPTGEFSNDPSPTEVQDSIICSLYVKEIKQKPEYNFDILASATIRKPFDDNKIIDTSLLNRMKYITTNRVNVNYYTKNLDDLKSILIEGVRIESTNKKAMEETGAIFRYNEDDKNDYRYGLTMNSSSSNSFSLEVIEFFSSNFPLGWEKEGNIWYEQEAKSIRSTSVFGIISGVDSRKAQIESGILYGSIALNLRKHGIYTHPIVQVTQKYEEMNSVKTQFDETYGNGSKIYMVFKVGYPNGIPLNGIRLNVEDVKREE